MTRPRIELLALGGTIATQPGAQGMKHGLGADDLVRMVPGLADVADISATTVLRTGSSNLSLDEVHALAIRIQTAADSGACDGIVVTQGTDTLEETSFLLDLLLDVDIPVVMTAAMRNPSLASADGAGNVLAAVRVAAAPWAKMRTVGVLVTMLDSVWTAIDVAKTQTSRVDAFRSPSTGPVATLVEDRVVPLMLPVRTWKEPAPLSAKPPLPVALVWLGLGEQGALLDALLSAPDHLGYAGIVLGAMGGGHVPESVVGSLGHHAARLPIVLASRAGGGPLLRRTYEGPGSEISLRASGLIFAGRLPPLKARLMLAVLLSQGAGHDALVTAFDRTG